nr:hypothetical protein GCM10020093_088520 [Planobispora longispora]
MLLDFRSPHSLHAVASLAVDGVVAMALAEPLPGRHGYWLPGPDGRHHAVEHVSYLRWDRPRPGGGEPMLDTPEWWFVRLYTGGFAASDLLVTEVLPPLVAEARAHGAFRWFFIRYTDPSGPHLRVRVFGPRETVDRMHRSLARIQRHADAMVAAVDDDAAWLASIPMGRMLGDSGTGLASGLYEPEYGKYGGPQGVELAERVFEFSSDLAIWATTRFGKIPERAAFAVLLLREAVRALIDGRPGDLSAEPVMPPGDRRRRAVSWERYWDRHLAWWTADLARHAPSSRRNCGAAPRRIRTACAPSRTRCSPTARWIRGCAGGARSSTTRSYGPSGCASGSLRNTWSSTSRT